MLDLETVSKDIMNCKKNQSIGCGWKKDWLFPIDNDQQAEIHLLWVCDVNKQWLRGENDYAWQCWGKEKKGKTIKTINKVNRWDRETPEHSQKKYILLSGSNQNWRHLFL